MPEGYKCDRCGEFTETGHWGHEEMATHGPVPRVSIVTDGERHDYTLCEGCRKNLKYWVENYD